MKLARIDDGRTGLVLDADATPRVLDVRASLDAFTAAHATEGAALGSLFADGGADWVPLIEGWDRLKRPLQALADWGAGGAEGAAVQPLDAVRLRPPLVSPVSRIFALGTNFTSHVASASKAIGADETYAERLAELPPSGFLVIPGSLIGHEDEFTPPPGAEAIDFEVEVAAVFASGGRSLSPEDVRIWGVTAFNDLSVRDPHVKRGLVHLDQGNLSWGFQKNWEGGNACGPWIVVDEGLIPDNLHVQSRVNGEVRQDGSTSEMIRSFGRGVEYISTFITMAPGDMLTSGTPAGTAIEEGPDGPFLQPGDVVEVEVDGVGVLRNRRAG